MNRDKGSLLGLALTGAGLFDRARDHGDGATCAAKQR